MAIITVSDLRKVYWQRDVREEHVAISDLSFELDAGTIISIVGQSGCGKSTLVRLLLGVERPTSGSVVVDGMEPYRDFRAFKGMLGVIFQEDRLLPWRTALENVRLGLEIQGGSRADHNSIASDWLARVGLNKFQRSYPAELSGGMRQRVSIARAFSTSPKVLLTDEAFGHLDEVTADRLKGEFLDLVRSLGTTTVFVTHQLDEAIDVGERTLVFGRPAHLLGDFDCQSLSSTGRSDAKVGIQGLLGQGVDDGANESRV